MIGSVTGIVLERGQDSVLIQLGGIGLQISCTPSTCRDLHVGDTASLATSLVVREDSLTLFGFADSDQREVFSVLQSVTGVGPRLALAVLATLTPNQLRAAVHAGDTATLTKISGIGRKGAQRMVLELADRLSPATDGTSVDVRDSDSAQAPGVAPWEASVQRALVGLGWADRDAQAAVVAVQGELTANGQSETDDVSSLLKMALRALDRR